MTVGQILCMGLFTLDALTNWLTSLALSYALNDNKTQKEQIIRVQLATQPPTSLIQHCSMMFQQGRFQKRVGVLMFLSTMLSHCPAAVSNFLSLPTNVPYVSITAKIVEMTYFVAAHVSSRIGRRR